MFKLGTPVKDNVTGLKGMLIHMMIEGDNVAYTFQPRGINPKTQQPVDEFWIDADRVNGGLMKHIAPGCMEHEHTRVKCARGCGRVTTQCEGKTEAICHPCQRAEKPTS